MYRLLYVLLCCLPVIHCFCPSLCTCTFHSRSDGTGSSSVLCNDPDMSEIPTNIPVDTVKLRVEKTVVRRVPGEAFYYLSELRYLWITYNSVTAVDSGSFYNLKDLHELRLDGNMLSLFPWRSLRETPSLRTLDLHNNRLSSVPADAGTYLRNVTHLDLSSNRLTTLPSDLMDIWPPFSGAVRSGNYLRRVVLGVQDNPWFCDCRISKLMELSKMTELSLVLMDPLLVCSGPENLAGVPFQLAELDQCVKPSVMTSATKVTSDLGSNVLLRCDATGFPTPSLVWTKVDGPPINGTVVQESPAEGTQWSIISINGVRFRDAGQYRCKAKNYAGSAVASILLSVAGEGSTTSSPPNGSSQWSTDSVPVTGVGTATSTGPSTATPMPLPTPTTPTTALAVTPSLPPVPTKQGRSQPSRTGRGPVEVPAKVAVRPILGIRAAEETRDSVALLWAEDKAWGDAQLTAVYSPYEGKDKRTVTAPAASGRLVLTGLKPGSKYMACLIAPEGQAQKDQCVTFSTSEPEEISTLEAEEEGPHMALLIISGLAVALVLPVIVFLLYKIACLCCQKPGSPSDLDQESYVKFETLSLKQRTMGNAANDLLSRRTTQDSERMLLFSRSSIDSQMTYKSDSSPSEFLC